MDEQPQSSDEQQEGTSSQEAAVAPDKSTFAPLPSLKRAKRPFTLRRTLLIAAAVVAVIALIGGVVVINRQRAANAAIAARAAAAAATQTAQVAQSGPNAPLPTRIVAISMYSPTDGWALEAGGTQSQSEVSALRISHGAVTKSTLPITPYAGFGQPMLQAFSASDVWALISPTANSFFHYDGHTWTPVSFPLPASAVSGSLNTEAFTMQSPTEGWAAVTYGVNNSTGNGSTMTQAFYHYDGSSWSLEKADANATAGGLGQLGQSAFSGQSVTSISASPDGDAWATGYLDVMDANGNVTSVTGYLYHFHPADGVWRLDELPDYELYGVLMTGAGSGWVIGSNVTLTSFGSNPPLTEENQTPIVFSLNGNSWASVTLPASSTQATTGVRLNQVVASSPSDVWIAGQANGLTSSANQDLAATSDYFVHYDGTNWSQVAPPQVAAINPNHDSSVTNQSSFPMIASGGNDSLWAAGGLSISNTAAQTGQYRPLLYTYRDGQWRNVPLPKS